ncbi:hypothetical protein [Rhizobium sp. BK176]|uniref:hypothetical protein n=1 Tax=Rhizobium sp. BK176 TaxID=2587071 RepID=UPI002166F80B|nr:hypothetical protein [Rhizobium sp. BK176]MCS4088689.1 hypothetical protein [Rhizobium sp. BK176]
MTVERRRALVERIFGAATERGVEVDTDPLFRSWIEEWIAGEIDMDELRRRYADLRRLRYQERRQKKVGAVAAAPMSSEATTFEIPPLDQNSLEAVLISLQNHVGGPADDGPSGPVG